MKTPLVRSMVALLACVALVGIARAEDLKAGDDAPAFELPGSDGKTYKLADLAKEQVVVVAWFPKAFTGGCTKECKSLKENGAVVKKFDVAYFTASCDTVVDNTKFAESLELDYPILSDADSKVARAYGVVNDDRPRPFRWTFYIGKDGKILAVDKEIKTETAAQDIAAKLKELGVEEKK